MPSKKFSNQFRRLQMVRMQEMRDGCVECRRLRGYCSRHMEEAMDIMLRPRKNTAKIFGPPEEVR